MALRSTLRGNAIVQELYQPNEFQDERWIIHEQTGGTLACFDENGDQSDEYIYYPWVRPPGRKCCSTARIATSRAWPRRRLGRHERDHGRDLQSRSLERRDPHRQA
jgi:hypothetical protein